MLPAEDQKRKSRASKRPAKANPNPASRLLLSLTQTEPASQEVKKHQKNINKKVLSGSGAR
jgi:hypothetical protein